VIRYLLDTNVLSEPLRPDPSPRVVAMLKRHQNALATAAPVWHELWFGYQRLPRSRKRAAIERYLQDVVQPTVPVLPYDASAAAWHASERARLGRLGRVPPFVDGQIASIARVNGLVLATLDRLLYATFEDVQVEDWRESP